MVVLIPKMQGEILTQIIMAKLIKASFLIHVPRLSLPKGRIQEISIGHGEDKLFIVHG